MSNEQPPPGQPQPRNPLRAALERFGRERRGQPQSSTAASADEVERRRRADSTAIEQGQPQQEPTMFDKELIKKSIYRDDDIIAIAEDKAVRMGDLVAAYLAQERQAGVHVHERGRPRYGGDLGLTAGMIIGYYCKADESPLHNGPHYPDEWVWYERGVADAAAQAKER